MDKHSIGFLNNLPTLLQNTHLDIHLDGWPAAAAITAVCSAAVAIASLFRPAK